MSPHPPPPPGYHLTHIEYGIISHTRTFPSAAFDVAMASGPSGASSAALRARLDAFLPTLRVANEELARQQSADPSSVDIEHLSEPDEQHIEMVRSARARAARTAICTLRRCACAAAPRWQDLACGVFDLPSPGARNADRSLLSGGASESESESEESGSLQRLAVPNGACQTAAMSEARMAGRTLISEVEPPPPQATAATAADEDSEWRRARREQKAKRVRDDEEERHPARRKKGAR